MTRAGLYATSLSVLPGQIRSAQAATASQVATEQVGDVHPSHRVPAEKGLDPAWLERLLAPGQQRVYQGKELRYIGMPIGGIGTGQLYLGGDGRLLHWDIFNRRIDTGPGSTRYAPQELHQPVAQGFALRIRNGDESIVRPLDAGGFKEVRFVGEYPIGRVEYPDPELPLDVTLEAFPPFIPLNAEDSALPVTVMQFTLRNTSDHPVEATVAGWLANAVCHEEPAVGAWRHQVTRGGELTFAQMSFEPEEQDQAAKREPRAPVLFADFEGDDYGDWEVEGEAFGDGPVRGSLPNQQIVSGFQGRGLVNSFRGGDGPTGRLRSQPFRIERRFINFLIGGGDDRQNLGMRLVVDGETLRTATGRNREQLRWVTWPVEDLAGRQAHLEIYDDRGGPWGHINVDHIEFADEPRVDPVEVRQRGDFGTMGLGVLGEPDGVLSSALLPEGDRPAAIFGDNGSLAGEDDSTTADTSGRHSGMGRTVTVAPGESRQITFVVAWHFPNLDPGGRFYATRFDTAQQAAQYVAEHFPRLAEQTRRWHDAYYDSTLPAWLVNRLHMPISTLATSTCHWWKNGRFWAWEGVGCCAGTCTHVWNYEQAMARLFPQLERSVRQMQDFGEGFQPETGLVGFRGESHLAYAADGQAGTILKAYREHLVSPDNHFLQTHWPQIQKALQFLFVQDMNLDGIIDNQQHNTYDIEFYGPNTFVGALYLAALLAAEKMAEEMEDNELARACRRAFERGSEFSMQHLFNGEYFIQRVNLRQHPMHQYADGCLADQLFGQNWAHQLGLGYLYPSDAVRKAVESVWRYNWAPDVAPQNALHPPERVFAEPGEPGMFLCTWPRSPHPGDQGVRYRDEVWSGIEYEVAAGLIYEGLLTEGLAVVKGIDERYDAARRNPWNEIECGDHYARAMASWGVLLALSGFEYDGPAGRLAMTPRLSPQAFRCAFTGTEGWGTLEQHRNDGEQTNRVTVRWGRLRLREFTVTLPSPAGGNVSVSINAQPAEATAQRDEANQLHIRFAEPVTLDETDRLEVRIRAAGD